jgi:hypothetical protein
MYTNIHNNHGIKSIQWWFDLHASALPPDFPAKKIIMGLDIMMRNNIFTFGNWYWRQLNGTTMGNPCACAYARIYYSYFKETTLVPPDNLHRVLFYQWLIDNALIMKQDWPCTRCTWQLWTHLGIQMHTWNRNPSTRASQSDIFLNLPPGFTTTMELTHKLMKNPWISISTGHPPLPNSQASSMDSSLEHYTTITGRTTIGTTFTNSSPSSSSILRLMGIPPPTFLLIHIAISNEGQ